jgi:YegS/Rv2252/BmrU family lipid kinase
LAAITFSNVVAIVNPLSGAGANPDVAAARVALLEARFAAAAVSGRVHLTERGGHAGELAAAALARGAMLLIAWGGDGTVNEVASVVAGTESTLGIVPAGSGNGFAHDLGIPPSPEAALDVTLHGIDRRVDVGQINGRSFFNIAGFGFDAAIATLFNACAQGQRGLWPYLRIGTGQAFRYRASRYRVMLDDEAFETHALLVAFANGREYGNGLRLAPHARLDDGRLEAVIVTDRGPLSRLWSGRHLALGSTERAGGVIWRSVERAEIECDGPMCYHVDGEPGSLDGRATIRIRPGALRVRVPAGGRV